MHGYFTKLLTVRFSLRKSGAWTLVGNAADILEKWEELSSARDKNQIKRRPVQYTRQAVKTVISMLDGSKTQLTYAQIADRLNDPNAASAYRVNETERRYVARDIRRLANILFPKVLRWSGCGIGVCIVNPIIIHILSGL